MGGEGGREGGGWVGVCDSLCMWEVLMREWCRKI